MKHGFLDTEPPNDPHRLLATEFLPNLWLGGEDGIDEVLFGEEAARIFLATEIMPDRVSPNVDVWIDFRNEDTFFSRKIFAPPDVLTIRMPFHDGNLKEARLVLPQAKQLVDKFRSEGKRILITCHAGLSRSATLALWLMSEEMGFDNAWRRLLAMRHWVGPDEAFDPLLNEIRFKHP